LLIVLFVIWFAFTVQDDPTYNEIWTAVQQGIKTTIWVSLVAYGVALVMGLVVALLRRSSNVVIYQLSTAYVEFIRGIPTLVLVYYIVLAAFPQVIRVANDLGEWMIENDINLYLGFSVRNMLADAKTRDIPQVYRAIIGLSVSYSAFLSEIFRAGIDSVDKGQIEAAKSLGMNRWKVTVLIILPQAIRTILPPLGNDFIALLKESSLVSVVGVQEITRRGNTLAASNFVFFQAYNVIALTYLIMTLSLSLLVRLLERYLKRSEHSA
jgi:polar amino acid transport system permease protein